jgi:hypothetical protein
MKKIPRFLHNLFSPHHLQNLDVLELMNAFNNPTVRKLWLYEVYQELRSLNMGIETALLTNSYVINTLSPRRKAYQDILEAILVAKRRCLEEKDPDPQFKSEIDLDRVTV